MTIPMEVGAHTRWRARYHYVWGTKYRHNILTGPVSRYLKDTVLGICERYGYLYDAIGTDGDNVHWLMGPGPSQIPEEIIRTVKSISARQIFLRFPSLKKLLWGGALWAVGYYWATVGEGQSDEVMRKYVITQGAKEEQVKIHQLKLL